ncbi:hypothetical protein ACHAXT_010619 [Thalassiosira profunda]
MRLQLRAKRTLIAKLIFVAVVVWQYTRVDQAVSQGDNSNIETTLQSTGEAFDIFDDSKIQQFNNSEGFDTKPAPSLNASHVGKDVEKILIIATAPIDYGHTLALWTHLECVTNGIDRVIIAAPDSYWSKGIVELVVNKFLLAVEDSNATRTYPPIETVFYLNNRYDIGLWCDGITHHLGYQFNGTDVPDDAKLPAIFLINDSAQSLRPYDSLTRKITRWALHEQREGASPDDLGVKITSLNGLLYQRNRGVRHHGRPGGSGFYWIESVYRGFTPHALPKFWRHSCRKMYLKNRVPCKTAGDRKRCIVDAYEKGLADWFSHEEIDAMFPSYRPLEWDIIVTKEYEKAHGDVQGYPYDQWLTGRGWHQYLGRMWNFPMKKVGKARNMRPNMCTLLMEDRKWLEELPYPGIEILQTYRAEMAESLQDL